jgi:hypothetical protein
MQAKVGAAPPTVKPNAGFLAKRACRHPFFLLFF